MPSIWQQHSFSTSYDLIIVGSGLSGLLSALKIKEAFPKWRIAILERGGNPDGASVRNAGFACFGSVSEILDDISSEGEDRAYARVEERWSGLHELIALCGADEIDLRPEGGFEIFTAEERNLQQSCLDAMEEINDRLAPALGFRPYYRTSLKNFQGLNEAIGIKGEAGLDSGKLISRLLRIAHNAGIDLHFNTEVQSFQAGEFWEISGKSETYRARKLLFCTNGFSGSVVADPRIVPGRGQIILTSPIPELRLTGNYHLHQGYYYFRQLGQRLMLGGGRHLFRAAETTDLQETSLEVQEHLKKMLREVILPDYRYTIENRWAGIMAFGPQNEKDPIVEKSDKGYYIAARLGGMGVAMAIRVAERIKDLMLQNQA